MFVDENLGSVPTKRLGVGIEVLIARKADLDSIGAKSASPTTNAEASTITTAHTATAPKGFFALTMFPETGQLTDEQAGVKGGRYYKASLAGVVFETDGIFALRDEDPELIVLVKDADCSDGKYKQMGDECLGAYLTATYDSGIEGEDGRKGYTITIESNAGWCYYDAAIPLIP